jgi:hypothetical protein
MRCPRRALMSSVCALGLHTENDPNWGAGRRGPTELWDLRDKNKRFKGYLLR